MASKGVVRRVSVTSASGCYNALAEGRSVVAGTLDP